MTIHTDAAASDPTERDGEHDFDFAHGTWRVKLSRLAKPLAGSTDWIEYEGTSSCRPLWDGRANIDEFRVHSPSTGARIDGLTLRLYSPETRAWSLYWANATNGVLAMPPTVGRFVSSELGEFFDDEELAGRPITVRYRWSEITPTSARFEQAFSEDARRTWEPNWVSTISRIAD